MTRNVDPIVLPTDLAGQPNGRIPRELMVIVPNTGDRLGHRLYARAHVAMVDGLAKGTGVTLGVTGIYRTYERQRDMFLERYDDTGSSSYAVAKARAGTRGLKFWSSAQGGTSTYWMHMTGATAASPGSSNHGLALAVDWDNNQLSERGVLAWMEAHSREYGFSWEKGIENNERWHQRYFTGDAVPQKVLDFEAGQQQPPVPVPPPNLPDGMEPWMKDYLVWFSNTVTYPSATKPNIKNPQKVPKELIQYAQIVMHFVASQNIVIDGDYGARSEGACRNVQAWFHLTVDGQVGPKETWPVLDYIAVDYRNKHGW